MDDSRPNDMARLIEDSSLGTPEARQLRELTDIDVVGQLLDSADHKATSEPPAIPSASGLSAVALSDGLSIGAVAERAGLSVSALRFYEERGLIDSTRSPSGQRRYRRDMLRRLAFIQVAQRVGLTLDQISEALATLPPGMGPSPADWQRLSARWRPMLDEKIRLLEGLRDDIDGCIDAVLAPLDRPTEQETVDMK